MDDLFILRYWTRNHTGEVVGTWVRHLVEADKVRWTAAALALMPGVIEVRQYASTDPEVPSAIHSEALMYRQFEEMEQMSLFGERRNP